MARVQKQFDQFNEAIKLKRFEENQTLREKRDIIRRKLRERLPGVFAAHGEECPAFFFRDQGSYKMGTGIKPLDDDFDIDQGLYFVIATTAYPDPVVLKRRVHEALDGHTDSVRIRRPCVTVTYHEEGEPIYHVDIAVYSDGSANPDGNSQLAKGREYSTPEHRYWEASDPQGLIDKIDERFKGNDAKQFRRGVRYLKRWKGEKFSGEGNVAPLGIGLTVATYDDLATVYTDEAAGKPDDLEALRRLVGKILGRFSRVFGAGGNLAWRLVVPLPVEPGNDLFEQMTDTQMAGFEEKLQALRDALEAATDEIDPVEACKTLQGVFGEDFPIPEKEETAKRHASAIVSSSNSA